MASSTSIPFSSTSLSGVTGVPTDTATLSTGISTVIGAVLTEQGTTVTALSVPGTTGLAVVDGSTISWRHEGVTLSNGDVVSIGFDGLVDSTTTASYQIVTVSASESVPQSATVTANPSGSLVTVSGTRSPSTSSPSAISGASSGALTTSGSSISPSVTSITTLTPASSSPSVAASSVSSRSSAGSASAASSAASGGSSTASASSTSSSGAAATLSAGRAAVALVGALGGMVAYGL